MTTKFCISQVTPACLRRLLLGVEEEFKAASTISTALCKKLFDRLDAIRFSLETLQESKEDCSEFIRAQLGEGDLIDLSQKICSLYGQIKSMEVDAKAQLKIEQMSQIIQKLESELDRSNEHLVFQEKERLKKHIKEMRHNYPYTLQKNLDALLLAGKATKRAELFLSCRTKELLKARVLNQKVPPYRKNSSMVYFEQKNAHSIDPVSALEILRIAEALYKNFSTDEAIKEYFFLSTEAQNACTARCRELGIDPLSKTTANKDLQKVARALVAASEDLSFGQGLVPLPSELELKDFFEGVPREASFPRMNHPVKRAASCV